MEHGAHFLILYYPFASFEFKRITVCKVAERAWPCGRAQAPEVVTAKGHGRPADWWSVGVLLFEMLTGKHPFSARNRQTLQKKILTEKLKIPPYLTQVCPRASSAPVLVVATLPPASRLVRCVYTSLFCWRKEKK